MNAAPRFLVATIVALAAVASVACSSEDGGIAHAPTPSSDSGASVDAGGLPEAAADAAAPDAAPDAAACPEPCTDGLSIRGRFLGLRGNDGTWRVGITTGNLRYDASLFDAMKASGKNLLCENASGGGGYGVSSASAYLGGNFANGFDPKFWDTLEARLGEAKAKDIGVLITVWGTVALEGDRSTSCKDPSSGAWTCRWDVNPWNANVGKGGPYQLPGCGKDAFYTLDDPSAPVYQPGAAYPAGASMTRRGQWRQEEYLHKLVSVVKAYPNVAINLMWEAGDKSSHKWGDCATTSEKVQTWHTHMRDYIHSLSPATLVGTGTFPHAAADFAMLDFLTAEDAAANWMEKWWTDFPTSQPVVYTGWVAFDSSHDPCGKSCAAGEFGFVRAQIREAWSHGIQVGSPFWEYKDEDVYAVQLDPYFVTLRSALDGIQSWEDEPGSELTASALPAP